MFNPEIDPDLPAHFSVGDRAGKKKCRTKLLEEVGLPEIPDTPVMGVVSRISYQKGMDLIIAAAEEILPRAQLIVLGAGDPVIGDAFHLLARHFKDRVAFHEGFHLSLAPRIYGGADMFLMPSSFEPCGLGQMIAMRYGTVPIVRFTGGLADTVVDEENGFVFYEKTPSAFAMAVNRAIDAYHRPAEWSRLIEAGMEADHSWAGSAREYEKLYERALTAHRDVVGNVALEA
jgi:starch synthase